MKWHWLPAALCLGLSPLLYASDDVSARDWLERMSHALETLNYEGTFVAVHEGSLEAMHLVHMVDQGKQKERLLSLNGAAREVVRDDERVICYWTDSRSVLVDKRGSQRTFPRVLPSEFSGLTGHYELRMGKEGRITGRLAVEVGIEPVDRYRYGYRLWLARDNALPLKSEMIDENGKPVEQIMFTSLEVYASTDDAKLKPSTDGSGFTWIHNDKSVMADDAGTPHWRPERVPPGFEMVAHDRQRLASTGKVVEHMVFSDGLASFSVYVEALGGTDGMDGISRMGAVTAFGRTIGDYQITVVGEVPEATVALVGNAIVPTGAHSP
ncbi:MAG: MucB/RseB C-terminal domain-containing protein [Chromatiales bacterium]|nr:MucB/RseB C-terminal domain-containing protein [Chromatiales bacterium]